jgi:hypothetical protein
MLSCFDVPRYPESLRKLEENMKTMLKDDAMPIEKSCNVKFSRGQVGFYQYEDLDLQLDLADTPWARLEVK